MDWINAFSVFNAGLNHEFIFEGHHRFPTFSSVWCTSRADRLLKVVLPKICLDAICVISLSFGW